MLAIFVAALNQMIVVTALPIIVADIGGLSQYSWVLTAYMLGATVSAPVSGPLSDSYGRRPLFIGAIALFMAGGVLGAAAASIGQLVAARGLQGLAAGAIMPLAMSAVGDLVPASERGRWQALIGGVTAVASVLGPLTGGWIADHAHWRWVFVVSLPVGLVAVTVVAATLRIPPHPERPRRPDFAGAALLAAALCGAMLGLVEWGEGRRLDLGAAVPLAAGLLAGFALVRHERRTPEPFVPRELLRRGLFSWVALSMFMVGVAMFGSMMSIPLFAQTVLGASAAGSGFVLMPLMVAMFLASFVSGHAITRSGRYRRVVVSGPPVMAAGFALLALLDERSTPISMAFAAAVLGLGIGLLLQNLVLVLQNGVPSRHLGAATSGAQFFRNAGGTLGVVLMGVVLAVGLGGQEGQAGAAAMADAIRPLFAICVPLMLLTAWAVRRIPEIPLRRTVREAPEPGSTI